MASVVQSIIVNANIVNSTSYTAPAGGYAIVHVINPGGTTVVFNLGNGATTVNSNFVGPIYIGPGHNIAASSGVIDGVEFINT